LGLSIDVGSIQPVTLVTPQDFEAANWMPEAVAFGMLPLTDVLVIEPGGGLGLLQVLAGGAQNITVVLENPSIHRAVAQTALEFDPYAYPNVGLHIESGRTFLQRDEEAFDIVFHPLTDAYLPVTSGAYSLSEDYSLTVEAFRASLARLSPDGFLVITRWLQSPPSESLRLVATLVEALPPDLAPEDTLVVFRGVQTVTVLLKPAGWTADQLANVRAFLESRRFDLVWAPDIQAEEVNRFNRLPEPSLYLNVLALLTAPDREAFYTSYPYNIHPVTDNQPFFFHFFTWEQTPELLQTIGHTWQPFGGSGYFVLLALLVLVLVLSAALILLPLLRRKAYAAPTGFRKSTRSVFWYFGFLGIAFLFVEIPLIQRWILILGQPIYAFTTVVAALLMFSGLGSALLKKEYFSPRIVFSTLVLLAFLMTLFVSQLSDDVLGWPFGGRVAAAILSLAPLGLLMGIPFPMGLAWLEAQTPELIPWAWAINGCASVVASVLAAILTLSYGFNLVIWLGAAAYATAWLTLTRTQALIVDS
jgi:hypothetical protein